MKKIIGILALIYFVNISYLSGQTINKEEYIDKMKGFWLGSCIANWTGLKTEGQRNGKPYYTDDDWNTNQGNEDYGTYIDFVLNKEIWGADDDTDIEYIYQHAMETYNTYRLTGDQIRLQWLEHISAEEENFLWVSNESAFNLMREEKIIPPATSLPYLNDNWEMIDAQLTTEIFGLLAPLRPNLALDLSYLPIRTTAYSHSMYAAQFYVIMHSLSIGIDKDLSRKNQILQLADSARSFIPETSYIAKMYDWVRNEYINSEDKNDWEIVRDTFHDHYIEGGANGYEYTEFYDCGSNFGFSIISLLFGEGDIKRTIQIGTLSGQDSDNPTATWGGLLGFMYGFDSIQDHFNKYDFSEFYNINRTRVNFGDTLDTFSGMARRFISLVNKVIIEEIRGKVTDEFWIIDKPLNKNYYLSSTNGMDDGDGTIDRPWSSLNKIDKYVFNPGDSILFQRGSHWNGAIKITSSGSFNYPIVFSSYGIGDKPSISNSNPNINSGNAFQIMANHITINDLYIFNCGLSGPRSVAGISSFNRENHHITIQNCEFSQCRVGVRLYANNIQIINNYFHSPGGGINEWWGPMAIVVSGFDGEIGYNTIEGFLAPNNYGFDGGAIEIDDEGIHTNWKIHHNISRGNQGFLETYDNSECDNCTWGNLKIYYNYSDDYQWFLDGPIGDDPFIENNTILRTLPANTDFNWGISLHHAIPKGSIRNNIFVLANDVKAFKWENPGNSTRSNIYFSIDSSSNNPKGYPLSENEIIADPMFISFNDRNLNLLERSPAVDRGENTLYEKDLNDNKIPFGNGTDIGAFESSFYAIVPLYDIQINNLNVDLDATGSLAERNQNIITYEWDFGDGEKNFGSDVSHSYSDAGTYKITLKVTSSSGIVSEISKIITVQKLPDPLFHTWHSYDVQIQSGNPQAYVSDGTTEVPLQFYISSNDDGIIKGDLLENYNPKEHPDNFNRLKNFWGEDYPYVGKSIVPQGVDIAENIGRFPGVLDLQMHPTDSKKLLICAFEVPYSGNYTISNFGIRRVHNDNSDSELKLFTEQKGMVASINGRSRSWNYDAKIFELKNMTKGDFIYFAVGNVDGFSNDAVEISWSIKLNDLTTGFMELDEKDDFKIIPNPSNGLFKLFFGENMVRNDLEMNVSNIVGKKIENFKLTSNNLTFDLSHYPPGIYIVRCGKIFKRLIIG